MMKDSGMKKGNKTFRLSMLLIASFLVAGLTACSQETPVATSAAETTAGSSTQTVEWTTPATEEETETVLDKEDRTENDDMKELKLKIDGTGITVAWEDNESVDALRQLAFEAPLTVQMSMYGGFEQVGPLGADLPRNDAQTVTQAGDIVLYSGDQIVVFYGSNTWAYTRLGKMTDLTAKELEQLLGNGNVTLTLEME